MNTLNWLLKIKEIIKCNNLLYWHEKETCFGDCSSHKVHDIKVTSTREKLNELIAVDLAYCNCEDSAIDRVIYHLPHYIGYIEKWDKVIKGHIKATEDLAKELDDTVLKARQALPI